MTYDATTERREFIAPTRAEAVGKACSFFGASEGDLAVVEVDPAQISGLAARVAVIAVPKGAPAPPPRSGGREPSEPSRRGRHEGRERSRSERGSREPAPRSKEHEVPVEPSTGTGVTPLSAVGEFVKGVVERMELGPFEIGEQEEGDEQRIVRLQGAAAAELAAGEGRTLDALQLLANQAAVQADGGTRRRVVLDVEGNVERRAAALERAAHRAGERAKESRRAVALEPMNARDRRTVHMALREMEGIATMSVGGGRFRQVVVVPEGAPEYEEALRYEAAASSEDEET